MSVEPDEDWSLSVAHLVVDALVDAGLVAKRDNARAVEVVTDEILVRLRLQHRPAPPGA